jgi:tetratricopeptide (TPR) repeat protein
MPVEAVANEHRMYLALAPVVAGLVLAVTVVFDRFDPRRGEPAEASGKATPDHRVAAIAAGMVILLLVVATQIRNQTFATPTGIWLDVLQQDKENFRAYWMMAAALDNEGDPEFATAMAEEAMRRHPKCTVLTELAKYHMSIGNPELAEYYARFGYDVIRKLQPSHEKVVQGFTIDLATVVRKRGEFTEMKELCEQVLTLKDQGHDLHPPVEIAAILLLADYEKIQGNLARADDLTTKALALARGSVPLAHSNALNAACLRADALLQRGHGDEARIILAEFVRALRAVPRRSPEQEYFLNLFLKMLRESGSV